MTIPNAVQQLGGRLCKAPMKLADQADVSAQAVAPATLAICTAERMTGHGETARLRLEQNII